MDVKEILAQQLMSRELINAFLKVNREDFLPDRLKRYAYHPDYIDLPLQITEKYTTTALTLGLKMLDLLELKSGLKVLEIGTGTGYYTALIAEVVGEENVITIEKDPEMYEIAKRNLKKYNIKLIFGDGSIGYKKEAPYDRAIIWAALPTFPCSIYDQLNNGGIIITPIEEKRGRQGLYKIIKNDIPHVIRLYDVIFTRIEGICGFYGD
ncbi:MAG: protein-L-isoaspartate O-methyltransferase [Sulfolobaceae archaeon]